MIKQRKPRARGPLTAMKWWQWRREDTLLKRWARVIMGSRPCDISYRVGEGSYMCFDPALVVVDPTVADQVGGDRLLPFQWRGVRVTRLEQLQKLFSRKHARHEGGHWEVTSRYTILGETHGWLANVLEDERMERLIGRRFRAARADFRAYARLFALRVLPLSAYTPSSFSREDALLNACLYWRWCEKHPGSFERFAFPCEDDRLFWQDRIRPLVERAWQVNTSQEVSNIAIEILLLIYVPVHASLAGHALLQIDGVRNPQGRPPEDQPLSPDDLRREAEDALDGDNGDRPGDTEGDEEPASIDIDLSEGRLWARTYWQLEREVLPFAVRLQQRLKLPTADVEIRRVPSGGRYSVRAAIRTRGRRSHEIKREEGDAPQGMRVILLVDHTWSMGGETGRIDPVTFEPQATFFDDDDRMPHARRVAMTLEHACPAAGVPLCIGVAGGDFTAVHLPGRLNRAVNIRQKEAVIWLRDWSTPPHAEGPKALIAGLYGSGGDERVSEALREARDKFRELPPDGSVDILLYVNDWEVDEPPDVIREALSDLRADGILVFSVYTGPQYNLEEVEQLFGTWWTIAVPGLARLPEQVGVILTKIRQGRGLSSRRRL